MKSPFEKVPKSIISFLSGVVVTAAIFGAALLTFGLTSKSSGQLADAGSTTKSGDSQQHQETLPLPDSGKTQDSVRSLYDLSQLNSDFARSVALHVF